MFRAITLSTLVIVLSACTTAGPYVTNISSDGNNGLNIENARLRQMHIWGPFPRQVAHPHI